MSDEQTNELLRDGWRQGNDGLWRNDRFGGSYKRTNALARIGSQHGEATRTDAAGQVRCPECGHVLERHSVVA